MGSQVSGLVVVFSLYIAFTLFAMLNVITGVFVESALKSSKDDNDYFIINNIRESFNRVDGGINSSMSWTDFESQLAEPNMLEYFKAIDVNPAEAKGLFSLLDLDGSGTIDAEEFLSGLKRLRGPAKALDLALLIYEVQRMASRQQEHKQHMEGLVSVMRERIGGETGRQ